MSLEFHKLFGSTYLDQSARHSTLSDGVLFSQTGMQETRRGHTEGGFHMVIITNLVLKFVFAGIE